MFTKSLPSKGLFWGLLALAVSSMASGVQASDLRLDQKKLSFGNSSVVAVRDSHSPKKVKLELTIPFSKSVCLNWGTRMEYGTDPSCGYDSYTQDREVCSDNEVCTVWKDGKCAATKTERSCRTVTEVVNHMRSCYHPESYCENYGTETHKETRAVKLNFAGLGRLQAGEEEVYVIEGKQVGYDQSRATFTAAAVKVQGTVQAKVHSFLGLHWITFKRE